VLVSYARFFLPFLRQLDEKSFTTTLGWSDGPPLLRERLPPPSASRKHRSWTHRPAALHASRFLPGYFFWAVSTDTHTLSAAEISEFGTSVEIFTGRRVLFFSGPAWNTR